MDLKIARRGVIQTGKIIHKIISSTDTKQNEYLFVVITRVSKIIMVRQLISTNSIINVLFKRNNNMKLKPTALVIEDNEDLNAIFSAALEAAGYTVRSVFNGTDAKELLGEIVPAIITLDLHMPGLNGTQILEYVRSQPRLNKVRVIVATADSALAESMPIQPELILLKPISYSQLSQLAACFAPNRSSMITSAASKI